MNPLSDARRGYSTTTSSSSRQSRPNKHHNRDTNNDAPPDLSPHSQHTPPPNSDKRVNSTNEQKKLQHAKDIWFRKSNIGYHCFIEYYLHQCDPSFWSNENESTTIETQHNVATASSTATNTNSGTKHDDTRIGNSRAAKRRRKKHGMTNVNEDSHIHSIITTKPSTTTAHETNSGTVTLRTYDDRHELSSHPLLEALRQHSQLHSDSNNNDRVPSLFFTTLAQPLPITFRLRRSCETERRDELLQYIEACNRNNILIRTMSRNHHNYKKNDSTTPPIDTTPTVEYYQCSSAAKHVVVTPTNDTNTSRNDTTWNDILIQYSQNGSMARQELGSMLPVLALQYAGYLHPPNHHPPKTFAFLDMCSSPGSKLLQAVEIIRGTRPPKQKKKKKMNRTNDPDDENVDAKTIAPTSGNVLCVANDVLQSRLEALRNAVQRSGIDISTTSSTAMQHELITYTNQDATKFSLYGSSIPNSGSTVKKSTKSSITAELIRFHVILCDVPCSGDGTCRKDKHILPMFTPNIGNVLHVTQVKILYRALQLLHVNGCVCYSTCSLNPIEDEAVVAAAMIQYNNFNMRKQKAGKGDIDHPSNTKGKDTEQHATAMTYVELIDCPKFDNVKLRNGISQWSVAEYQHDNDVDDNDSETTGSSEGNQRTKKYLQWYDTYDDAVRRMGSTHGDAKKGNNNTSTTVLTPSLWPSNVTDHAELTQSLSKCQRLLPHDQDSGGFFIALIRKCTFDETNDKKVTKSRKLL